MSRSSPSTQNRPGLLNCRAGTERNYSISAIRGYTSCAFLHPSFIFWDTTPKLLWFFCTRAGPGRPPVPLGDKHQTLPEGRESRPGLKDREHIWEWDPAVGSGFLGTHPAPVPPRQDLTTFNPPQNSQPELICQQVFSDNISLLKGAKNSHINSFPFPRLLFPFVNSAPLSFSCAILPIFI